MSHNILHDIYNIPVRIVFQVVGIARAISSKLCLKQLRDCLMVG